MSYLLYAIYPGGLDMELDRQLERTIGLPSAGSGFDFRNGEREVHWAFDRETQADRAAGKLSRAFPQLTVEVEVED